MKSPPMTMLAADAGKRNVEIGDLHPIMRAPTSQLVGAIVKDGLRFRLFEGYRGPDRQDALYAQGRTKPGERVTNARGWEGAHQFGLAADFVWFEDGIWSWRENHPWDRLEALAVGVGLVRPIRWDRPHLEHPAYAVMRGRIR